jgi:hypothetical protein
VVWIGGRGAKQEEDSINVVGLSFLVLLLWSSDAVTDIRSQIEISTPSAVSLVLALQVRRSNAPTERRF